jgi:hypothetical protein
MPLSTSLSLSLSLSLTHNLSLHLLPLHFQHHSFSEENDRKLKGGGGLRINERYQKVCSHTITCSKNIAKTKYLGWEGYKIQSYYWNPA